MIAIRQLAMQRKGQRLSKITFPDIRDSVLSGDIIEDYPDDRPLPSCLIFGNTLSADAMHSVWGYNSDERLAVLITAYRPDPGPLG